MAKPRKTLGEISIGKRIAAKNAAWQAERRRKQLEKMGLARNPVELNATKKLESMRLQKSDVQYRKRIRGLRNKKK